MMGKSYLGARTSVIATHVVGAFGAALLLASLLWLLARPIPWAEVASDCSWGITLVWVWRSLLRRRRDGQPGPARVVPRPLQRALRAVPWAMWVALLITTSVVSTAHGLPGAARTGHYYTSAPPTAHSPLGLPPLAWGLCGGVIFIAIRIAGAPHRRLS